MRINDYLERIGLAADGPSTALRPDVNTLRRLHLAHRETFLFENLTIQSGGRISVALEDLQRKFLDERRGGYCFEHNTLFAGALQEMGFAPVTLLGRVRRGPPEGWRRTHMVLRMMIGGEPWLADVGFGALGLLEPIPLADGETHVQGGFEYRLRFERDRGVWALSLRDAHSAMDLYEFSEDPQTAGDVEVANHYTATHPDSIFRRTLTIQRSGRRERIVLRNDVVTRMADGRSVDELIDRTQLPRAARDLFGVELPPGPFVFERDYSAAV
jgi:N-hydroxyarylamine O-acetyltransferase